MDEKQTTQLLIVARNSAETAIVKLYEINQNEDYHKISLTARAQDRIMDAIIFIDRALRG